MNDLAIGVFDSGVGGLSVAKQIKKTLPLERIVYFGDTARIPYGNKSIDTIKSYTEESVDFLLNKGVKAIVIACNTISAIAREVVVEKAQNIPVIDVISSCSHDIVHYNYRNIGVIATNATIKSMAYTLQIKQLDHNINIYSTACPLFVPMIEEGMLFHIALDLIAKDYLQYFSNKNIDCLILGCTHYSFIQNVIKTNLFNNNIVIYDPAIITAYNLKEILSNNNLLSLGTINHTDDYYVTDNVNRFYQIASILLDKIEVNNIHLVKL